MLQLSQSEQKEKSHKQRQQQEKGVGVKDRHQVTTGGRGQSWGRGEVSAEEPVHGGAPESCRRCFICGLTGWMKQEVKKRVQPLTSCFLQRVPNIPQNMADEVFGSRRGPSSLFSTCCLSLMGGST